MMTPRPTESRMIAEIAALKAERDELRTALLLIVENCDRYDGVLPSMYLEGARAILKRTEQTKPL